MTCIPVRQPSVALDRLAAGWAIACAIHCIALPVVLFSVPSLYLALYSFNHPHRELAMGLLALIRYEPWFVAASAVVSTCAVVYGWRRHRRWAPAALALSGIALLIAALLLATYEPWVHTAGVLAGGALLVVAHALNARIPRH